MKINFTNELSNLLFFTGETATAIRMYSLYAREHTQFTQQDSLDLMFLADSLHYFSEIHHKIIECAETGKCNELALSCKRIVRIFEEYKNPDHKALSTFKNPQNVHLVDLNLVIGSLKAIIEKCET